MATLGSENQFPKLLLTNNGDSSLPDTGLAKLYVNASKVLHFKDDTGADVAISTGLFTDPMTTRGDMIIRNASNVTARLGRGSAAQVLTSDGTDIAWATPTSGFADPMTTRGDMIARVGANTTTRLGVGGTRTMLTANGTDPAWQAKPTAAAYKRTSGNYTTSSTTFADVDATNLALSITTLARRVMIGFTGTIRQSGTTVISLTVDLDGTNLGAAVGTGGYGGLVIIRTPVANYECNGSFTFLTDVLSAASHTFKLQWATTGATATMLGSSGTTNANMQFWVAETLMEV